MSRLFMRIPPITLAAAVLSAFQALPAAAQSLDGIVLTSRGCTTINCNATVLSGRINGFTRPVSGGFEAAGNPWVASFNPGPVNGAGCLRFDVTAETSDLAMAVIGPDRKVYTNDDSHCANGSTLCPRVVVRPLPAGFYTVVINRLSGVGDASFGLAVGRYSADTNPNCTAVTAGRAPEVTAKDAVAQKNR